jgi:predicted HTH transcriptional regulator
VEFKHNNADPEMIGKYVSALSNAARLGDQQCAYLLWGVRDGDHEVVGTPFDPAAAKHQKQPLEFWIAQRVNPSVAFSFKTIQHPSGRLVLLEIPAAVLSPVEFNGVAYIRIGSATPRLSDHPPRLRALWDKLRPYVWETGIAEQFRSEDEVLSKLDSAAYFSLTGQPQPASPQGILDKLTADRLIAGDVGGRWNITNLGATLFAKQLDAFDPRIARKGVRFVAYNGNSRADTVTHRRDDPSGYANGFEGLIRFIDSLLPRNEHIAKSLRAETPLFPAIAIRELVANALIHQDMTLTGAGPMIELFKDRMEITNPGAPLINPDRFIDSAPRSRNEALAALMRRMRMCEEQGTGIDKVVTAVELFQLPPPDFRASAMRVVLYAPRRFAAMTADERVRACYQHAVLKFVSEGRMKNSTLRERFGIEERNAAQVSQVIRQALDQGKIRPADPEKRQAAYIPSWA